MAVTKYGYHETLTNNWQSVLSGAITAGDTSITVADATGLPTKGFFRVKIESEIVLCNGRSGNVLSVASRGAEGTTAASHSSAVAITAPLTAGGLQKYLLEHRGTAFTEEATATAVPVNRMLDESGNVLTSASFTWVNQGTATGSDSNGGLVLTAPAEASTVLRAMTRAVPSTPYRFYTRLRIGPGIGTTPGVNAAHAGLCFYQSSSGKFVTLSARYGQALAMWRWTNTTTFSATVDTNMEFHGDRIWLMFEDDGTNFCGFFSHDGNNWTRDGSAWWQESRTAFLTTTSADYYGLYINSGSGLAGEIFTFESFVVEQF